MRLDAIKEPRAEIYGNAFTASELKDIIWFYQTPRCKKAFNSYPR